MGSSTKRKKIDQDEASQSPKVQKTAKLPPLAPMEDGIQVLLPSDDRLLFVGHGTIKVHSGEINVCGNVRGAGHDALEVSVDQVIAISVVSTEATIPLVGHGGAAFSISYTTTNNINNNNSANTTRSNQEPSFQAIAESESTDPMMAEQVPVVFPPPWTQITADIAQSIRQGLKAGAPPAVIVVCGAKKVGKSSLTRLLTNVLLNDHPCVAYLDSDCGQPEFTPPGLVSLSYITTPVLGTPSSHQRQPEVSYFIGDVSPSADPHRYVGCIEKLYADYIKGSRNPYDADLPPLIVNTHGWIKGHGLMVLMDLLRLFRISHFVNVTSDNDRRNLPDGRFWGVDDQSSFSVLYKIQGLKEGLGSRSKSHPSAVEQRAELWQAFAKSCLTTNGEHISCNDALGDALAATPPYVTSLAALKLNVLYTWVPETELSHVLNATVVGLCVDHNNNNDGELKVEEIRECIGLGLIRAVDVANDKLYVLTPVDADSLERVTVLEIGRLELPSDLVQTSQFLSPYLALHSLSTIASGSAPQRARNNLVRAGQVR